MKNAFVLPSIQIIVGCLLTFLTCLLGDKLLNHHFVSKSQSLRAVVDSVTHGFVGVFSWMIVVAPDFHTRQLVEMMLCGALASALDIDHFIAAGSLKLKDALALPSRPPFHNTTLVPVITVGLYLCTVVYRRHIHYFVPIMIHFPWIFMVAWLSHHIRDATRRGLWFAPLGSTPALPQWLYIWLCLSLPVGMNWILKEQDLSSSMKDEHQLKPDSAISLI